jgi:hypothetical protein
MVNFRVLILSGLVFFSSSLLMARPSYKVVCEKADECPEWVAGLAHDHGVCSSFLVAPNIIGTNLHCIPEDLRHEKASCKDRIVVSFPKTAHHSEETIDCEEMVHVSPPISDKFLTPDFAFFRLKEKTTRDYLEISQAGIADGALITLYKVDPGEVGIVRKVQCPAVQNSLFNPYFQQDKSPLVSLIPCPVIKGNSGSALVGADGKAHGIIFSIYDVHIPMDPTLAGKTMTGAASNGANFSCLNTFFLNYVQGEPEACLISIDEASQKKFFQSIIDKRTARFQKEINEKLQANLKQKSESTQGRILWDLTSAEPTPEEGKSGIVLKASLQPKCLLPASKASADVAEKRPADHSLVAENYKIYFESDAVMRPQYRVDTDKVQMNLEQNKLPICGIE